MYVKRITIPLGISNKGNLTQEFGYRRPRRTKEKDKSVGHSKVTNRRKGWRNLGKGDVIRLQKLAL